MKKKRSLPEIIYAVFLIISFVLVFFWFMEQNSRRTEEYNRDYAADSARLKSEQIDEELDNALNQINTEEYLRNMLNTTYFGEEAQVYLCTADGRVIASSDDTDYEGRLLDMLTETGMIDQNAANQVRQALGNGSEGAFICDSSSRTDNLSLFLFVADETGSSWRRKTGRWDIL